MTEVTTMDYEARAREVLDVEIEGLQNVRAAIGDSFSRAATLMLDCLDQKGKIVVSGVGKNLHIAEKLSATLASTGATSVVLHPTQAMHGDLGILSRGDVLLALSYSGASEELLKILPVVQRLGIPIVGMTAEPESELARCSTEVLSVAVEREACPFNMAPTTSTTATLALGDALAMVLLDARGFRKEDYALLHPAGAIGRTLLLHVSDIMRTGERLACVVETANVESALFAMTQARAGSVAVVDAGNKVLGIFTDGDLRRHVARADLLTLPIRDLMTVDPFSVNPDQLAVNVLKIYEDHAIDDLLVVDDDGCLVGAIDIQDLPKLKIL
ncbi:MAG: KpsF/GutQ family sugar-phosphate isomerase [Verrucomicrobia bacterium]|jgi:arabinose-5-phosphate isomerase|nr:KpsF/GutQ family sugar-phosphate isomerase [Verrucomicrobiota bacterium]MBT7065453.1 KpsF/GutQ family sugar-phosphate isomerase [Verrucomicrobiota bacterium]MBT7701563.1 KpsF/GutQ family sugar-phosphate isomerase [Verrucomicrobiota bacterium]